MDGEELIAEVRTQIKDTVSPYLFSDETILRHLQEAERRMCRDTHVLVSTTETQALSASTPTYTLGDHILRVYASRIQGETKPLNRLRGAAYGLHLSATEDTPTLFSTNVGHKKITFYPVPDTTMTAELICAVMPTTAVAKGVQSSIPDEHQNALIDYASYRCLVTNDADGEQVGTAREFQDAWGEYIRDLKRDIYRYRTDDKLVLQNWTGKVRGT